MKLSMHKFKQLAVIVLVLLAALPMSADKGEMRVSLRDGTTVSVELADKMQGTFYYILGFTPHYNLLVYSGKIAFDYTGEPYEAEGDPNSGEEHGKIYFDMEMDEISDLSFADIVSVDEIQGGADIGIDLENGVVSLSGIVSPVDVTVHSVSGQLQYEEKVSSDRKIDIRLLGAGVHIVKAGSSTFKILTK